MHDAVDPGDDLLHLRQLGEVGGDELLVGPEVARGILVAQTQARVDALEQGAQPAADAAGGSGDEDGVHGKNPTMRDQL